ncbi:hypothetical protein PLESTF_001202700 [Pleodorina starrii]|nr:hypothetical protein PLESTF_001202700 [Pleodorina starrii]
MQRWVTPLKLSRLSEVLRMPVTRVETVLQGTPAAVRQMEPEQVAQRLLELSSGLGVLPRQAAFMVAKQPTYMLLTPLPEMRAKIAELSATLGVPQGAVLRAAVTIPSILARSTAFIDHRVRAYSALLRCSPLDVLHVMARGPEYLSDTPSSVRQRMTALGYVLRRPRCTIAAMLQARPDLVFMSRKVMNTKVNGMMCILNKQKHHVVTLVVKLPSLLRCNLDAVRHAFGGLQALLQKREGFVYAMVCHAPSLLLLTPRGLHQRCTALRRCLSASPEWCEEFAQLRPPGVAQLVLNRRGSLSVMMYLTQRRRAGAARLAQLLALGPDGGPAVALAEAWPDFQEWMERRRQYVALRTQQGRAAMLGAAVCAAQAGPSVRPVAVVPQPQLTQQLQDAQQQHDTPASAVGCPRLSPAEMGSRTASGVQPAKDFLVRHTEPGLAEAGTGMQLLGDQPAAGVLTSREGCSSSSGGGGDSRTTSSCSGVGRCESGGSAQQDTDSGTAADRGQQPGASASGRPPSWLQLQAEFRKSLQSRARRKSSAAAQQGVRDKTKPPNAPAASPPSKRARLRRHVGPQRIDLAMPSPAAVWETTAAAASAVSAQRFANDSGSASMAASGQSDEGVAGVAPPSVAASSRSQSMAPLEAAAGAFAAGEGEFQHILGVGQIAGSLQPDEALRPGSAAQVASSNVQPCDHSLGLQPASASGQQHWHVLGGLLLPGRGQPPGTDPSGLGLDGLHAAGWPEASGVVATVNPVRVARTAQLAASDGSLHSQRADPCIERCPEVRTTVAAAAAGGTAGVQCAGTSSSSPARSVTSDNGDDASVSATCHAMDTDARALPLWLHLDSSGTRNSAGGPAHSGINDGLYGSERARSGEGEAHHAAPAERGAADEVMVVVGDGSVRDVKGLGREPHARGLRGQENGGGLSIGQAQKLESALGAIVPR